MDVTKGHNKITSCEDTRYLKLVCYCYKCLRELTVMLLEDEWTNLITVIMLLCTFYLSLYLITTSIVRLI